MIHTHKKYDGGRPPSGIQTKANELNCRKAVTCNHGLSVKTKEGNTNILEWAGGFLRCYRLVILKLFYVWSRTRQITGYIMPNEGQAPHCQEGVTNEEGEGYKRSQQTSVKSQGVDSEAL